VLTRQEKTRTLPVAPADKVLAWAELWGNPEQEKPEAADEVHIPDYVMQDFGLPRRRSALGRHCHTGEEIRGRDASDTLRL
jgi:hypothetical protein